jgi:hypothetical protein
VRTAPKSVLELAFQFGENLVIWKGSDSWNGFGFFGESRHGKTPLSFAFARLLVDSGLDEVKVFDDCFESEQGKVRQCRVWGNRNALGEEYYNELVETLRKHGRTISEIYPFHEQFEIGKMTIWLLLFCEREVLFRMEKGAYDRFLDDLMKSNPFRWNQPKPDRKIAEERLKMVWDYSLIYRNPDTTRMLIDALATKAFELKPI